MLMRKHVEFSLNVRTQLKYIGERSIKRFDAMMQKAKVIEKTTPQEFSRKI